MMRIGDKVRIKTVPGCAPGFLPPNYPGVIVAFMTGKDNGRGKWVQVHTDPTEAFNIETNFGYQEKDLIIDNFRQAIREATNA